MIEEGACSLAMVVIEPVLPERVCVVGARCLFIMPQPWFMSVAFFPERVFSRGALLAKRV